MKYKKGFLTAVCLIIGVVFSGCSNEDVTYVIENDHVKVADYKGIEVKRVVPVEVDAKYLEDKFAGLVEYYNSFMNMDYEGTSDETVTAVTGGSFSNYEDWCGMVRAGYVRGEEQNAVMDMSQIIWETVFSKSELTSYSEKDYEEQNESIKEALLFYAEADTVEEYCEKENVTDTEFEEILDTTSLYFLKYYYILDAIGEKEGLCPTEEEMERDYLEERMAGFDAEEGSEEWNEKYEELLDNYESIYYTELSNRVFDFLYQKSVII